MTIAQELVPCTNIETRTLSWAMYKEGEYLDCDNAAAIAGQFGHRYADDAQPVDFGD